MAITVLPRRRGLAEELGLSLGTGLGTGIESVAEMRLQSLLRQQQQAEAAQGLRSLGFAEEEAQRLSQLPLPALQDVIKERVAQPRRQRFGEALSQVLGVAPEGAPLEMDEAPSIAADLPLGELSEKQALDVAKLQLEQQKRGEQARRERRKEELVEEREIKKETAPIYREITKEAKGARENLKRLGRLEQLAKTGKLGSPLANSLIKTISKGAFGIGLDLNYLMTADAQEFEKLSTDFVKNAKGIFGNRITDADLRAFMKTVPTLSQSREGMLRVIRNLRLTEQAKEARKRAMDSLIKENKGKRPRDLDILIEERAEPELDELARQFRDALSPEISRRLLGSEALGGVARGLGLIY